MASCNRLHYETHHSLRFGKVQLSNSPLTREAPTELNWRSTRGSRLRLPLEHWTIPPTAPPLLSPDGFRFSRLHCKCNLRANVLANIHPPAVFTIYCFRSPSPLPHCGLSTPYHRNSPAKRPQPSPKVDSCQFPAPATFRDRRSPKHWHGVSEDEFPAVHIS